MLSTVVFVHELFPRMRTASIDLLSSRSGNTPCNCSDCSQNGGSESQFRATAQQVRSAIQSYTSPKTEGTLLFVAYLSAPGNFERREKVRHRCFYHIKAAGASVKFFIGRPSQVNVPITNDQGQLATDSEAQLAKRLQAESDKYQDIVISPFRDTYRDLTDKVAFLFRYGIDEVKAQNVLKIDDDWCPDMRKVLGAAKKTKPGLARYVGQYLFKGTEYPSMKGRDGTIAPFMTGVGFMLSASLIRAIFFDDLVHSLLFAPYGTSSDDANVGKWVQYAKRKHPELKFSLEVVPNLVWAIDPQ